MKNENDLAHARLGVNHANVLGDAMLIGINWSQCLFDCRDVRISISLRRSLSGSHTASGRSGAHVTAVGGNAGGFARRRQSASGASIDTRVIFSKVIPLFPEFGHTESCEPESMIGRFGRSPRFAACFRLRCRHGNRLRVSRAYSISLSVLNAAFCPINRSSLSHLTLSLSLFSRSFNRRISLSRLLSLRSNETHRDNVECKSMFYNQRKRETKRQVCESLAGDHLRFTISRRSPV